jgi:hypothetical protein
VLVSGPRGSHAEVDIVRHAEQNSLRLIGIGATRPFFAGFQIAIPNKYFNLEEGNDFDNADMSFKCARIAFAVNLGVNANSAEDFAEASYEALMALDEPEAFKFP